MAESKTPRTDTISLLNDLVENSPIDFLGTGSSDEFAAAEEKEYNERIEKLRSAILELQQSLASARQAEEKESERWAKRLEWIHREYDADASGCDSGDALDCVEIEIRQALCKATERARQAAFAALFADIEAEISHIEDNGKKVSGLPGGEDEGRCRQLCAMYLREFISSIEVRTIVGIPPSHVCVPPGKVKPDTDKQVFFYEQEFYVLSNFSSFRLMWRGTDFDTSEHAYHFEKFSRIAPAIALEIKAAKSAHEAFKIAERNKDYRRSDWDDVKVDIMREILRAKATQHEYVRRKLLQTGNRELIEDSWRDDFWGWGPNRDGKNMLGKLWMEIRAELAAHEGGGE